MSLDFILVKGRSLPATLEELEPDQSFGDAEYRQLASRLFEDVRWESDGTGHARKDDVFVELHSSDASLSLWCRGKGDIMSLIYRIAVLAHGQGAVVVDVQDSTLVAPPFPAENPAYVQWYRSVIGDSQD